MRHRHTPIACLVALCLFASSSLQPALAGGLIPTEQVADTSPVGMTAAPLSSRESIAAIRVALSQAMVQAGVDPAQAQERLASLTDAEVRALAQRFDDAPAGGLWFAPFLVVAIVIGALIGSRGSAKDPSSAHTDLFGRLRNLASAP